ncbi:hypothetical protein SRABI106_01265 [Rahnella aquatilis]|nr:hypothetical protein SRABI106_01265 [Rahnella aquatilis]
MINNQPGGIQRGAIIHLNGIIRIIGVNCGINHIRGGVIINHHCRTVRIKGRVVDI